VNGHIPGAQFLTLELKFEALDTWPKDTRIVCYSNAGHRSLEVASYFMAYGFTNVRNMAGGLEAWSGELQVPTVPPITVEVSAINDRSPGPYDVRIDE
jgi:monothiol glutaredoxin